MNTSARVTCVVVLALLALVGTVPAGQAKGPTDVAVSGPGVDDVHLTYTARDDVDAGSLGEASRLYDMWSPGLLEPAPDLTEDELGPRYVLTWSGDPHSAETGTDLVVQHAYPFAEGGAWVEFPSDQVLWGAPIAEGWIQTPKLAAELVELGAVDDMAEPAIAVEPETSPVPSAPETSSHSEDDSSSSYAVAVWTGVALAVIVAAGVVLLWRRRLSR